MVNSFPSLTTDASPPGGARDRRFLRVSAIIPAYNEAERIGRVLDILTSYPRFREVVIVDDGSDDTTGEIARRYLSLGHVRYLRNEKNIGKGASMDRGVREASGDIIFFCDADIVGLTHEIIDRIIEPVLRGDVEMFIGMRHRPSYTFRYILTFVPLFGGERALTKRLWEMLPPYYKERFRIEAGLNFFAKYYGKGFAFTVFRNLGQTVKERKYGFFRGLRQRIGMFADIFAAEWRLHAIDVPPTLKNRRLATLAFVEGLLGFLLGALLIAAAFEESRVLLERFSLGGLRTTFASAVGLRVIGAIGAILLVPHLVILIASARRMLRLFRQLPLHFRKLPEREE